MGKFDKIGDRRKADRAIKDAKKQGKIKEKQLDNSFKIENKPWEIKEFKIEEPKWFLGTDNELANSRIELGNNSIRNAVLDWDLFSDTKEKDDEQKFEQVHEDMAELRKYSGELESEIVSLRTVMLKILKENKKLKKEFKDQKEEMHEFLQKKGDLFEFMKEKMTDVKRERNQRKLKPKFVI